MIKIAFISKKGGVGKSTLSTLCAAYYAKYMQEDAIIADFDTNQSSAALWYAWRRASNMSVNHIEVMTPPTIQKAISKAHDAGLLIIDTPANADRAGIGYARAAHLIGLPTGVSRFDLDQQIRAAYSLEKAGIARHKIAFIMPRVSASPATTKAAIDYIKATGFDICGEPLSDLTSINDAQAIGKTAAETGFRSVNIRAEKMALSIITKATACAQLEG